MGDLNSRRGRIQGMDNKGGKTIVKAEVPMAEMLTYGTDLTSMTQGRGSFSMEMHHYDFVPALAAGEDHRRSQSRARRRSRSGRVGLLANKIIIVCVNVWGKAEVGNEILATKIKSRFVGRKIIAQRFSAGELIFLMSEPLQGRHTRISTNAGAPSKLLLLAWGFFRPGGVYCFRFPEPVCRK